MKMIAYTNLHPILTNAFPVLRKFKYPTKTLIKEFALLNYFTDFFIGALRRHEYKLAEDCLSKSLEIYKEGDLLLRRLMKGIFFDSFNKFLNYCTEVEKEEMKAGISPNLLRAVS